MEKEIRKIHPALRDDIGNLITRRPLPGPELAELDPFLFLNHHGPQRYPSHNTGLPFGPHPHRGFETVTFILKGDISHRDTAGHESIIKEGGIQWMTAGKGLVHSETSSEEFKRDGGDLEILQLWINLPARLKMTEPRYVGRSANEIPSLRIKETTLHLVSGNWQGFKGAVDPLYPLDLMTVEMNASAEWSWEIPDDHTLFVYVVRGDISINGRMVRAFELPEFGAGTGLRIRSTSGALFLLGHAKPFHEPIVSYGPFVMNTKEEIVRAIRDFEHGRFA